MYHSIVVDMLDGGGCTKVPTTTIARSINRRLIAKRPAQKS